MVVSDRRTATRFRPAPDTCCRCAGGDGLIWNLSVTGARLLLERPLRIGEVVQVVLANNLTALPVWARIVHVRQVSPVDWFVGAQFVRPLTGYELESFVARDLVRALLGTN